MCAEVAAGLKLPSVQSTQAGVGAQVAAEVQELELRAPSLRLQGGAWVVASS